MSNSHLKSIERIIYSTKRDIMKVRDDKNGKRFLGYRANASPDSIRKTGGSTSTSRSGY